MEICDDGHDEIVYQGGRHKYCPVCTANEEIAALEDEINTLQEKLDAPTN